MADAIALYDIKDSVFLVGVAAQLNSNNVARDAYARVAERMLGLAAPAFSDATAVQLATDAVAMQVAHMMAGGVSVYIAKSESRGQRSITYRDDASLNPIAKELADQVNTDNGRTVASGEFDPARWATVITTRPVAEQGLSTGFVPVLDIRT